MVEGPSVLEAAKKIVVFDHRKSAQDFIEQAVLLYHEPYASSTSELITEMIQHIGKRIKLRSIEADALAGHYRGYQEFRSQNGRDYL